MHGIKTYELMTEGQITLSVQNLLALFIVTPRIPRPFLGEERYPQKHL